MVNLRNAVEAHKNLVAGLRAMDPDIDDQTLADTAEGETKLDAAIIEVLREAEGEEDDAEAIQRRIETLRSRKARKEAKAEKLRAMAKAAMEEADLPSIHAADITASLGRGPAKVIITNEAAIPDLYMRIKKEPAKSAIAEALKAGDDVPGAVLGNPGTVLRVRRD